MPTLTWAQWLSIASLVISLLALTINFSKFFIELYDRKHKRKKEAEEADNKLKGRFNVYTTGRDIHITNESLVDIDIKEIYFDGETWEESGLFSSAKPYKFTAGQTKSFSVMGTKQNKFPKDMSIHFADPYMRKKNLSIQEQDIQL